MGMSDFISRNALLDDLKWLKSVVNESSKNEVQDFIDRAESFPKADAVEVVRCKDCKHWDTTDCGNGHGWCPKVVGYRSGTWYCAAGERRTNGTCK